MRNLILIIPAFLILGCNSGMKKKTDADALSTIAKNLHNKIDCDTAAWYKKPEDRDSVLIYSEERDAIYYTKGELKRILRSYPELNDKKFYGTPDEVYARQGKDRKLAPCDIHLGDCEVCKDNYYVLYAYFLRQRNGEAKYTKERRCLVDIYRQVNFLFGKLQGGGTYFGHQFKRIVGYAEYAVYLRAYNSGRDDIFRNYDITKQKKLYIAGLKQLIEDSVSNDYDLTLPKDQPKLKRQLFETVDDIDRLITNDFYLKMTQQFQYSNY